MKLSAKWESERAYLIWNTISYMWSNKENEGQRWRKKERKKDIEKEKEKRKKKERKKIPFSLAPSSLLAKEFTHSWALTVGFFLRMNSTLLLLAEGDGIAAGCVMAVVTPPGVVVPGVVAVVASDWPYGDWVRGPPSWGWMADVKTDSLSIYSFVDSTCNMYLQLYQLYLFYLFFFFFEICFFVLWILISVCLVNIKLILT